MCVCVYLCLSARDQTQDLFLKTYSLKVSFVRDFSLVLPTGLSFLQGHSLHLKAWSATAVHWPCRAGHQTGLPPASTSQLFSEASPLSLLRHTGPTLAHPYAWASFWWTSKEHWPCWPPWWSLPAQPGKNFSLVSPYRKNQQMRAEVMHPGLLRQQKLPQLACLLTG